HTQPTVIEWRVQVINSTGVGRVEMHLISNVGIWEFNLTNTEIRQAGVIPPIVVMNTTDTFHTYRVEIPANSINFELFVDGVSQYAGSGYFGNGPAGGLFYFGESGPPHAIADWDYVRLGLPSPPPNITNISPNSGAVGILVTITGENFGNGQGSTVAFGS